MDTIREPVLVPDGELAGSEPALLLPLDSAQALFSQPNQLNAILVSSAGDVEAAGATVGDLEATILSLGADLSQAMESIATELGDQRSALLSDLPG